MKYQVFQSMSYQNDRHCQGEHSREEGGEPEEERPVACAPGQVTEGGERVFGEDAQGVAAERDTA